MSFIYDKILNFINFKKINLFEINQNDNIETYFDKIESNIMSDILLITKKSKHTIYQNCTINSDNTITISNDINSIINNIILINNEHYIVSKFNTYENLNYCKICVYPIIKTQNNNIIDIKLIGYIGDKLHQYSSLLQIKENIDEYKYIINSIVKPCTYTLGDYNNKCESKSIKCNNDQTLAINSLKYNIEIIHGPPGTGKTTTIVNMINEKIPNNHVILCTAVQNQAIESIVTKLMNTSSLNDSFVVIGDKSRLKKNSSNFTIENFFENNKSTQKISEKLKNLENKLEIIKNQSCEISERDRIDYINKKNRKIQEYETALMIEKAKTLLNVKIFVSTIGSSHKLYNYISGNVDTIIIDEAGATSEMQLFPLLRLKPKNIILIGDHKQLAGFSNAPNNSYAFYTKSLLEKMVISDRKHNLLKCQYRMPDYICKLVSKLFYNNLLYSDKSCVLKSDKNINWINVTGVNKKNGFSFYNNDEINKITEIYEKYKNNKILILTFYNCQLELLKNKFKNVNNVTCRSVDSCQGMESDIVIISLVKSDNNSDFINDPKRICVMLSRTKNKLIIVGNKQIFSNNDIWKNIITYIDDES